MKVIKNTTVIVCLIILAVIVCTTIYIKKMKISYNVYFANEYGEEVEKAYSVYRTREWTKEDEIKTEEYKQACIVNKIVVPTGIKIVPTYVELMNNPYFLLVPILILYFAYIFINEFMARRKKPGVVNVKIVEPVEIKFKRLFIGIIKK